MRRFDISSFMTRVLGVLIFSLALTANASAQEVTGADVFEYGIYEIGEVLGESAPPNLGYRHTIVSGMEHKATTRVIPGALGITFGIRFKLEGDTPGAIVPVTTVMVFPPLGLIAPGQEERLYVDALQSATRIGDEQFMAHTFDYPWEIVPGIWTIEVWSGGKKLAEEQFEVVLSLS